jgi:hypothetical protein
MKKKKSVVKNIENVPSEMKKSSQNSLFAGMLLQAGLARRCSECAQMTCERVPPPTALVPPAEQRDPRALHDKGHAEVPAASRPHDRIDV